MLVGVVVVVLVLWIAVALSAANKKAAAVLAEMAMGEHKKRMARAAAD